MFKNMKFNVLTFENFFKVLTIVKSGRPAQRIGCNYTLFKNGYMTALLASGNSLFGAWYWL